MKKQNPNLKLTGRKILDKKDILIGYAGMTLQDLREKREIRYAFGMSTSDIIYEIDKHAIYLHSNLSEIIDRARTIYDDRERKHLKYYKITIEEV